ncbi:hypothetical protein RD110_21645 [Rhodoferax koreense]|uniref:TIGR03016 family PEP-CTERM system-associated outer membrane protein n=1 Tax=Rhodoferax koreensis TaxID=1842727 RepID=A0A1P8K0G3_9BURK|nr:TIGR03016 family PEP-CTERM system-associated outer membrane protein [Rhodoferax koreense]APW39498.1 hypothetical protein RD110_21645 [Rhodoferax koreense]
MAMSNSKQPDCALNHLPMLHKSICTFFEIYCLPQYASRSFVSLICVAAALSSVCADAQQIETGGGGRGLTVTPRLTLSETYSSNINLSSTNKQSEFTTEISPGIRISSDAGRLRGYFDYSLSQLLYARNSDRNELQNSLSAAGTYEAIDQWAFLDFSGTISQQSISAFGTQSLDNTSLNSNRTEVATYRISPYVRGHLSNFADYEARYKYETTRSKSNLASDVDTRESSIKLNGDSSFSRLKWAANLSSQNVDYSLGRNTSSDQLNINLIYSINSQVEAILIGGKESNNYVSVDKQSHSSNGFGLNWRPSDTTRFSGQVERRYFGSTHAISLEHRTPRTAWSYVDNKSVSNSSSNGQVGLGGLYDLLYSQFASVEPDPVKRAQLVRSFLQVNGLDPNTTVVGAYSTAALSLQRSQTLTFALIGIRDTITLSANRSMSQSLSNLVPAADDFANTSFIRQNGVTLSYSHRLTPDSSLNVLVSQQKSAGDSSLLKTKLRAFGVNLSTRLNDKMYGNIGARHVISDSSTSYKETTLTGSVNIQF